MSYWLDVLLDNIKVVQGDGYIEVTGIRVKNFIRHIGRVYGTVRFTNGMLTDIRAYSFRVSKFYLYDFYNIVKNSAEEREQYYNLSIIRKLLKELEKIPEIVRLSQKFPSKLDKSQLSRFRFTPLEKQSEFFDVYDLNTQRYALNGYILGASPGTGKTLASLMLMAMLLKDITVVFSPNNALNEVWKDTIEEVKGTKVWVYPEPLNPKIKYTHYVFSHENTKFAMETLPKIFRDSRGKSVGIIVDECHKFTELAAAQTNNLVDICKMSNSKDILFMSGTPFKAMGRELVPFIMATDPTFTDKDLDGFRKIFGASGNAATEILSARIGRVMFKIEKSSVVNNDVTEYIVKVKVPDGEKYTLGAIKKRMLKFVAERTKFYQDNREEFDKEYLAMVSKYAKILKSPQDIAEFKKYQEYVALIKNTSDYRQVREEIMFTNRYEKNNIMPTMDPKDRERFRNLKSIYKYVSMKIQGEALGRILGRDRTECNIDIVKHIDNGQIFSKKGRYDGEEWTLDDIFDLSNSKVIMFTDFVEVLKVTDKILKQHGYKPEVVYGETNKDLINIIERAKNDPKINPVVATYKSLSTAVPLIFADTVVLLNSPYRSYIYEQTTARVDRLGQEHPVNIFTYQLDTGHLPNISTRSKEIMEWSKKMVEELLGFETEEDIEAEIVESMESLIIPDKPKGLFHQWK